MSTSVSYLELLNFARNIFGDNTPLLVPYSYPLVFVYGPEGPVPSGIQVKNLEITANADFILTNVSAFGQVIATPEFNAAIDFTTILITDGGTGNQFMNSPVLLANFCSINGSERLFNFPRFIPGRTSLTVQLNTQFSNGGAQNLYYALSFNGVLCRKVGV